MPSTTTNYGLKKPYYTDIADVGEINGNFDELDEILTPAVSQNADPTAESVKGKLAAVVGWLANRVKAITGKSNWYDTPAVTLENCNSHIESGVHTPATSTKAGIMAAADKQKLDNAVSSNTASRLMLRDASGRAQVSNPSAAYDIVNKTYADGAYIRKDTAGTMAATLTAHSNSDYTTKQVRNIVFWTSGASPPITSNGDIVIKLF
jgi:hypothetical protein